MVKVAVLLGGGNGNHTLMSDISGHAIEFRAGNEANRQTDAAALLDDALQAQIMPLFGNADELEIPSACFQGLADGINAVDLVHLHSLNALQAPCETPTTVG